MRIVFRCGRGLLRQPFLGGLSRRGRGFLRLLFVLVVGFVWFFGCFLGGCVVLGLVLFVGFFFGVMGVVG